MLLWFRDRKGYPPRPLRQLPLFLVGFGSAGKSTFAQLLCAADVAEIARLVQNPEPIGNWSVAKLADWAEAMPPAGWSGRVNTAVRKRLAAFLRTQGIRSGDLLDPERSVELARHASSSVPLSTWTEFTKAVRNHHHKR